MEAGGSGAAESLEVMAVSTLRGSSGYSDGLALSPSQRDVPASVQRCGSNTGHRQRLPGQAEVSHAVKHL